MLLTITYTGQDTTDLSYLLYKNPYRPQMFELNHGKAYVFYPEVSNERTTAALLLDIDPIDLARGKAGTTGGGLFDYVNDRPYVSSSFLSTAISKVFGTAMTGRADAHQALSDSPLNLAATVTMLPCRGEQEKLKSVFEPLGYEVSYETFITDENFPHWGNIYPAVNNSNTLQSQNPYTGAFQTAGHTVINSQIYSKYVNLTISGKIRLRDLLKHLYVLIPVFDRQKHYWVGADEVDKLLRIGEDWLPGHPEREYITGRYLNRRRSLMNMAFERLMALNEADGEALAAEQEESDMAEKPDRKLSLNTKRLGSVVAALKSHGVTHVIDIGCGEGNLLNLLIKERQFTNISGVDVSHTALERANKKLKLERAGDSMRGRVKLFQGSLTYKDERLKGYDAACVIEVIEHLDMPRLAAFARVLFEFTKPPIVVMTTPNFEYNEKYEHLNPLSLRHSDHRFEYTRAEFRAWAAGIAEKYGYTVQFSEIGDRDAKLGAPTQMGVFKLCV